ncbi:MAG: hypothetical protein Q8L88_15270 [Bacteroidota bacterium]|nr:hypothetical protein [Bacteroidota bacterium]
MKKICLMLLFSSILVAQNPDGKNISLHVTPVWEWGKSDFERTTRVQYDVYTQIDSYSYHVTSVNYGLLKYPLAFGIHTQIKIPTTSFLTLTFNYSYNQRFEEEDRSHRQTNYFSEYNSVNGMYQTVSATISVYNLFSLYLGE